MTKHLDIDTKAMRAKILDLAIRGKLTDQRQEDGNARDLLKEIQAEKERLIKEKKIKKEKPLPEIEADEIPFAIPKNWVWVRLGDICQINPRNHVQDENVNVSFLPMALIGEGYGSNYCPEIRKWKDVKKGFTHFANNDVVLAKISPCFQNLKSAIMNNLTNGIGAGTTELHVLRRYSHTLDSKYLLCFVQNQNLIKDGIKTFKGVVGQQRIGKDFIKEYLCPLPPLAEQHRIADKVSTFFAQLDAIDKAYEEYRELQQAMKAKLLDLAIQGKLTDQRKEDGDARELFQDIQEEKQGLIAEKEIKKEKPLPEIEADEIPFAIPKNWVWVRLNSIYNFIDYRGKTPKKLTEGIPLVTAKNVRMGYNDYSVKDFISAEEFKLRQSRGISHKGDLLFTTEAPLGNVSLADLDCFSTGQRLIDFQAYNSLAVSNKLFMYFIMSSFFQQALIDNQTGTTVAGIKASRLKAILIPLPPLAEQKRIVAKLDELLPLL
jgi:type I restriction enzyme S subunit